MTKVDGVFLAAEAGNKDWSAASEGFIWSPVAVPWFLEPGLSCLNVYACLLRSVDMLQKNKLPNDDMFGVLACCGQSDIADLTLI